ncbi:unnamed protein product [Paramecium sonneborni]|uniref:Uncharacterized protein n=1 Tax=Paramecium sonneborni TaxID=65129 RepID=A0A8S1P3K3_9CILI|nr:unnamed protein product [Paramecium sonneborni]
MDKLQTEQQQQYVGPNTIQPTQSQQLSWNEALALLPPLPDRMTILHTLQTESPCFQLCGGRFYEESIIDILAIGKLSWKIDFQMPSCCCANNGASLLKGLLNLFPTRKPPSFQLEQGQPVFQCCCRCDNYHQFSGTSYYLENELINFEFKNYGRLYIQGVLMLEFQQCQKAFEDVFYASENSTMPQMLVYQPYHRSNYQIRFKAEKNKCPQHPYSFRGYWSCCDCSRLERKFEISGLSQGTCEIINTRTSKQACYKACGCKDVYRCDSCRYADYPFFDITFNNVTQIDRLAIIMCLIHFIMYNEWEWTNYYGIQLSTQIDRALRLAVQQEKEKSSCSIF